VTLNFDCSVVRLLDGLGSIVKNLYLDTSELSLT
jgi:hypothetical protein